MSDRDTTALEVAASNILRSAAPGKIRLPGAMQLAGFTADESKIAKLQMRVRRLILKSTVPSTVPSTVKVNSSTVAISTITNSVDDKTMGTSTTTDETPQTPPRAPKKIHPQAMKGVSPPHKRPPRSKPRKPKVGVLSFAAAAQSKKPPPEIQQSQQLLDKLEKEATTKVKATKRTSHQKRVHDARMIIRKEHDVKGHKLATALVAENRGKKGKNGKVMRQLSGR
jgi:hypothetical protein